MKKILILTVLICFGSVLKAQQLPQITQYMINDYAINPAVAGMEDYYQVKTTIRNQWEGIINDPPRTTILSIYGSKSKHIGLGGLVYNDQTGPTSRIGGSASYTYLFSLTKSMKMAFALSGGFIQYKLIKDGLTLENQEDPFISDKRNLAQTMPDATFGFNMFTNKWYIGAAVTQLLPNKIDYNFKKIYEGEESTGSLAQHIYILGAYEHAFTPFWEVEPSVLIKSVSGAPMQMDLGIKTTYNDNLWVGMNYRDNGELAALVGYSIQERYIIGYSYDMMSAIGPSHEIMLGIRFIALEETEIMQ